jgi:hypothetical protein
MLDVTLISSGLESPANCCHVNVVWQEGAIEILSAMRNAISVDGAEKKRIIMIKIGEETMCQL